jgi:hypothetical protein
MFFGFIFIVLIILVWFFIPDNILFAYSESEMEDDQQIELFDDVDDISDASTEYESGDDVTEISENLPDFSEECNAKNYNAENGE